jgi:thiamine-phosphate diphosphorylase
MPRELPRLHLIATDAVIGRSRFSELAGELIREAGPGVALHLRARELPGRELYRVAERLLRTADSAGATLLINDRVDVALAVGAAGVQLGAAAIPVTTARTIAPDLLIGASVHSVQEAGRAHGDGADFLLAGTLWPTATHPDRPGSGTAWLGELPTDCPPVIGIGGIDAPRAAVLRVLGLHGVAVVRAVWDAGDPRAALRALRLALYE